MFRCYIYESFDGAGTFPANIHDFRICRFFPMRRLTASTPAPFAPAAGWFLARALTLAIGVWMALSAVAFAGDPVQGPVQSPVQAPRAKCGCLIGVPRGLDEVWLLSTRSLGCPGKEWSPYVAQYEDCQWHSRALTELVTAATPETFVVVYVHGNRVTPADAKELGWRAYDGIARDARPDQRIVFVIWSWPSEGDRRPLRSVRENAHRCETDAIYLSRFVQQLPLETKIGLFGFSFGGRIITGGVSDLAESDPAGGASRDVHVVLQSPAVDNRWLYPGWPYESYGLGADATLLFYNPCDRALARFRLTDRCTRPEALGYTGLGNPSRLPGDGLFEQRSSSFIGSAHSSYDYLDSPTLMDATRRVVLFEE